MSSTPERPEVSDLADWWDDDPPVPHDPAEREAWEVDGDRTASWALRKLAERRAEVARLRVLYAEDLARLDFAYQEKKEALDDWLSDASAGAIADADYFDGKLLDYTRRIGEDDPGGPKTRRVPGGVLSRRRNPPSLVIDPEQAGSLVRWCLANGRRDLLSIRPDVSAIKACVGLSLQAPDLDVDAKGQPTVPGQESPLVTATGEKLPGVTFVVGDLRYDAKPDPKEA